MSRKLRSISITLCLDRLVEHQGAFQELGPRTTSSPRPLIGVCVAALSMILITFGQSRAEAQFEATRIDAVRLAPEKAASRAEQPARRLPPVKMASPVHSSRKSARDSGATGSQKGSPSLSSWTAVAALAGVIALILLLARVFRRHAPFLPQGLPNEALELLGRRFVDQRQAIHLVRVGARILIVGSSQAGLHPLGEIEDAVEVDLLAGLCRSRTGTGGGTSFLRMLRQSADRPRPVSKETRPTVANSTAANIAARPSEAIPSGLSQPEYELMQRLRGTTAPTRERSPETMRGR